MFQTTGNWSISCSFTCLQTKESYSITIVNCILYDSVRSCMSLVSILFKTYSYCRRSNWSFWILKKKKTRLSLDHQIHLQLCSIFTIQSKWPQALNCQGWHIHLSIPFSHLPVLRGKESSVEVKFAWGRRHGKEQMPACQILCRWTHYYSSGAGCQTSQAWGPFTVCHFALNQSIVDIKRFYIIFRKMTNADPEHARSWSLRLPVAHVWMAYGEHLKIIHTGSCTDELLANKSYS